GYQPLTDGDSALDQEAADLIGHSRALADEARTHAMESQQVHLLRRLDAYEPHRRPLHGFGVAIVILVVLEERLHVLRRDEAYLMTKGFEWPADMVRSRTGLHADQTGWNIGEPPFELSARDSQLQDDCAAPVEANQVEGVLANINADRRDVARQ